MNKSRDIYMPSSFLITAYVHKSLCILNIPKFSSTTEVYVDMLGVPAYNAGSMRTLKCGQVSAYINLRHYGAYWSSLGSFAFSCFTSL